MKSVDKIDCAFGFSLFSLAFLFAMLTVFAYATPAHAQQAFVPYTVSQDDHAKLMAYLGEQPAKIAIPLMQALSALEQKAIEAKAKTEAPKSEEKP